MNINSGTLQSVFMIVLISGHYLKVAIVISVCTAIWQLLQIQITFRRYLCKYPPIILNLCKFCLLSMTDTYGGKVLNIFTILRPERKLGCNYVIFVTSRAAFSWLQDVTKQAYRSLLDWRLMNIRG